MLNAHARQRNAYATTRTTARANALLLLVLAIGGTSRANGVETMEIADNTRGILSIA
jgi:hypothetical protein